MIYLIPYPDFKAKNWALNGPKEQVFILESSVFFHFVYVVFYSIKYRSRPCYIFRYMSDHDALILNLVRLLSDTLIIVFCYLFFGKVKWIKHNVDKETNVSYPRINGLRLKLVSLCSSRVYVTDQLLLPYLNPKLRKKSDSVGFGVLERQVSEFDIELEKELRALKNNGLTVGLCATALSEKCYHLKMLTSFLDCLNKVEKRVVIVFIAKFSRDSKYDKLKAELESRSDVVLYTSGQLVNEKYLAGCLDFIYRSLDDISVPFTIYNSANAEIPVLTHNVGFTSVMVQKYHLGGVVNDLNDFNYNVLISLIDDWSPKGCRHFLRQNSWVNGARKIFSEDFK